MNALNRLKVQIFADGADKAGMLEMYAHPAVKGFTTNPTLMRKAGVVDYEAAAKDILAAIPDRPISFEVFADEFSETVGYLVYQFAGRRQDQRADGAVVRTLLFLE